MDGRTRSTTGWTTTTWSASSTPARPNAGRRRPGLQAGPAGRHGRCKRGDTVTYWVSSGKPQATVPDLANLTQADAETALADAGLKLGTVTHETSTTVAGRVGHQPGPGRGHEGRQGLGGEHRRLDRLAVAEPHAVADARPRRASPCRTCTACSRTAAEQELTAARSHRRPSARSPTPVSRRARS